MTSLSLRRGALALFKGRIVILGDPLEDDRILTHDPSTRRSQVAEISDLAPSDAQSLKPKFRLPLSLVSKASWERAKQNAQTITALIQNGRVRRREAEKAAEQLGVSLRTLYRRIAKFRASPQLTSLIPRYHMRGGHNKPRIPKRSEEIITDLIHSKYLTDQRITVRDLMIHIRRACKNENIKTPCENTVRSRIRSLDVELTASRRDGKKAAADLTRPIMGSFEVDRPMELIQIDHTILDLVIVDELTRQPIGRPTVTYAVDVYSRCIVGFYLSLQAPDAIAVACCLSRSALPKDEWLKSLGINAPWKIWGKPSRVMVDNAKEFDSDAIRRGFEEHQITLEFRPVKQPWMGGHIESLIKTQMLSVHTLPGTTKSNIQKKGEYEPDKNAVFTFRDVEAWLAQTAIIYNNALHSQISTTPIARYNARILGDETTEPCGYPPVITDAKRFFIDFLPYEYRTIQKYGVQINGIRYNADSLQRWVHRQSAKDQQFLIAYDKRNMRVVYFFDPEIRDYFEIGTWNRTRGDFSYWQVEYARKTARERGHKNVDEDTIFQIMDERTALLEAAAKKTKTARRAIEREKSNRRAHRLTHSTVLSATIDAEVHLPRGELEPIVPDLQQLDLNPYESEEW